MIFTSSDLGYATFMQQPLIKSAPQRRAPASWLASIAALVLTLAGAALLAPACGGNASETDSTPKEDCEGGYITPEGVCQGKCDPAKCLAENTCVGNQCLLTCDSHRDCFQDGSQDCAPAKEDGTEADIHVCQFGARAAGTGIGRPFGGCEVWLSCPDNSTCFATQCGDPNTCVADDAVCNGDPDCKAGKCPDGSYCRVNCVTECQQWLECQTYGEGDADSYCTSRDCATDDDCIGGYYCGVIHDPHELCGSNPKKGDNGFCGETTEPCIDLNTDQTSRYEGSLCILRRSCLKRDQYAPCSTDLDCSHFDGLKCVSYPATPNGAPETRCARGCASNLDCQEDAQCDAALGACVPRYGSWKGDPGQFCAPCKSDDDCGGPGTTWGCVELSGGMRGCIDLAFPDMCTSNLDCPKTPGGKSGYCVTDSGSSLYHRCYIPLINEKYSCW